MVEKAAMLVVGDDEERLVPGLAGADMLVELLHVGLALDNRVVRVLVRGRPDSGVEKRLDEGEVGKVSIFQIGVKIGEGPEFLDVLEGPHALEAHSLRNVVEVNLRGFPGFVQLVEDRFHWVAQDGLVNVVEGFSVGGSGEAVVAVWFGWAWDWVNLL